MDRCRLTSQILALGLKNLNNRARILSKRVEGLPRPSALELSFREMTTHPLPARLGTTRGEGEVDSNDNTKKANSRHRRKNLELWSQRQTLPRDEW